MHELGIITSVLDSATQAAHEAGAERLLKVSLSIGEMTEAIEEALVFAFEAVVEQDPFTKGAQLELTMITPKSRCLECGCEFTHDRFHRLCPECGSFATELLAGRELQIDSIEVDLPDDEEPDDEEPASYGAQVAPDGEERAANEYAPDGEEASQVKEETSQYGEERV